MSEGYRDIFLRTLKVKARMAGLPSTGATASEFIAALPNSSLLGADLSKDVRTFLYNYTMANIAKGKELEKFTFDVTARLPDSFFDTPLVPGRERPTFADATWLVRTAVSVLGLTPNGENCVDSSELPLAA